MRSHSLRPAPSLALTPVAHALRIGLLSLALSAAAHAQEQAAGTPPPPKADEPATTLPTVTVKPAKEETATGPVPGNIAKRSATGTKTDTPLIETPQSISVLTADRIQTLGIQQIKEALAYTPGVNAAPFGRDSRYEWINLRGFDAYSPGFFQDGLLLRNNGNFANWRTEAYGAERIEVLRGPASVLYGQANPGGVVNVVSKRPTAEPLREFQVQLGSSSSRVVAGDFSGPLTEDGEWLYRVTGLARNAELGNSGLPDDRVFLAPSLTWRASADTSITFLSHVVRNRAGTFWSGYPVAGTLLPNPNGQISSTTFIGEPDFERFNQDQWAIGYALEHRVDDSWTLRQNLRRGYHKVDFKNTSSGGFVPVNADPTDPTNFRRIRRFVTLSNERVNNLSLDNQAQAKFTGNGSQHVVLLGLDYQRNRYDEVGRFTPISPIDVYAPVYGSAIDTNVAPYGDRNTTLKQAGFYVQDQIKWADRWVATLGARHDRFTINGVDRLSSSPLQGSGNKWTGRAGLVYLAPSGWAPYLSYSESFFPTQQVDPATGSFFKPEAGRQYEAGVRYQPAEGKASYSASVFDLRRQGYITNEPDTFTPRQTGEVVVHGLELEALLQPDARTNVTAAYSYTPSSEVTASVNPVEIGKELVPISKHQLSLWADYRFIGGIKAGLGARYTGSSAGDLDANNLRLPAYTLFDAMVGYDLIAWALAFNVQNLTDKTHVTRCGPVSCYYGAQRKLTATATYRW